MGNDIILGAYCMNLKEKKEQYYPSKDLCIKLDIADSTLRKWCLALEKNGYNFTRTEQNRRLFTNNNIEVLEQLKHLVQTQKMNLENGSIIVSTKALEGRSPTGTPSVPSIETDESSVIQKLNDYIEKQEQFNQELLKRLDKQNTYINENLKNRDRVLMETMNNFIEERRSEVKKIEENKKGVFGRLFGRK